MLALILSGAGCGGNNQAVVVPLSLTLAPSAVTVLVGSSVQFALGVNGNADTVSFLVNDVAQGNATVGTITTDGLYQAPPIVPGNTAITIKVKASDSTKPGTSAEVTATVTLDSGVRVKVSSGSKFTIGTSETYPFAASVVGVPTTASIGGVCDNATSTPVSCNAVTWSLTGVGSIDPNTGVYTAPSTVTTTTATVTAKAVYDTTQTAAAAVTIVTATDPTLSSISNTVGAVGAVFQDVYLAGSNFISTTNVFLNGTAVDTSNIVLSSSSVLRVRIPDSLLTTPGPSVFTAAQQVGMPQPCSDPAQCTITLSAVRPAIVGASPDTIQQRILGTTPVKDFNVNGGYFGTTTSPSVTGQYGGQNRTTSVTTTTPCGAALPKCAARQLSVTIGGAAPANAADLSTPGLFPVTIQNSSAAQLQAVANVAIQPSYPASATSQVAGSPLAAGTFPSAVAINTATGIAVVANQGSNSITLIDLKTSPPTRLGFICTANQGATLSVTEPSCAASGPISVAVDNLRNLALVANQTAQTVAVVDLTSGSQSVSFVIPAGPTNIARVPMGIGVNPVSGLAIVAYRQTTFASIIDLKKSPYAVTGLVAASTGLSPRVAVSARLNWAVVTPGSSGSLSLVDLNRQSRNSIATATCSGSTVTISTTSAHTLRPGDPVLITGATGGTAINGVFAVVSAPGNTTFTYTSSGCASGVGGTANYALPIATVATSVSLTGAAFNDETQNAILVDPTGPQAFIFSALDQTSSSVPAGLQLTGNIAGAFNPLANLAITVNRLSNKATVIDPVTPAILTSFDVGSEPMDVAIDPGTNTAVIANRTSGDVSIYSLGALRTPQVLQVSRQETLAPAVPGSPISPQPQPPEVEVTSTMTSPATYRDQTLTIIGSGFISGTSKVRLDGVNFTPTAVSADGRQLTVKVPATAFTGPGATLTAGPRLYALDVVNGTATSNATSFTVVQSVDVSGAGCAPQGVAIDSRRNLAVVTNSGCNSVALINLAPGPATGTGSLVAVGTNPQGVAVHLQSGLAVVANQDSNNASIVDVAGANVVATVSTDPGPTGVAIDPGLGLAVVTASNANVIDTFAVSSSDGTAATSFAAVQQRPVAVAVDPDRHFAAVANTASNTVSLVDLTQAVATEHVPAPGLPAGIVFDPVSTTFLTAASLANQVLVLDPVSRSTTGLRVGINPTSIAYNFASSTLVTTNSSSQTMSVVDFLSGRVRAVLSFTPSGRFAVDIHPFSNLAVIADSAHNKVFLRPLPR